jgi:hypothetical protein
MWKSMSYDDYWDYDRGYDSKVDFNMNLNFWSIIILLAYILQLMWFIQFIRSDMLHNNLKKEEEKK